MNRVCASLLALLLSLSLWGDNNVRLGSSSRAASGSGAGENNISIGVLAGAGARGNSQTVIGVGAGMSSTGSNDILIGEGAGRSSAADNAIIIGAGAGKDISGEHIVILGSNEATNEEYKVIGLTSINGRQIYFNEDEGVFAFSAVRGLESVTNAPIYYRDGVVHFNAGISIHADDSEASALLLSSPEGIKKYVDASSHNASEYIVIDTGKYDLFMAPYGNDNNDGLTITSPKATFDNCITTLGEKGGTVAVLPGQYAPIALINTAETLLRTPEGICTFIAVGGKDRTSIVGKTANDTGIDDGIYHSLALASGNTIFDGFTISHISGYAANEAAEAYHNTAPAFSCVTLKDCRISGSEIRYTFTYSAFNTCFLTNTVIDNVTFTSISSGKESEVFSNCLLVDAQIRNISLASKSTFRFFGMSTEAYYSLFDLPAVDDKELQCNAKCAFDYCTFKWQAGPQCRLDADKATHSLFVTSSGISGMSEENYKTHNNCSITDYILELDDNLVPKIVSCAAVIPDSEYSDDTHDIGWRDSGLGHMKAISNGHRDIFAKLYLPVQEGYAVTSSGADGGLHIALEEGSLIVYAGNEKLGTLSFTPASNE